MKKIFIGGVLFLGVLNCFSQSYADETSFTKIAGDEICVQKPYIFQGGNQAIVNISQEYGIGVEGGELNGEEILFSLQREGEIIEEKGGEKYVRIFNKPGNVELVVNILDTNGCVYQTTKKIRIFEQSYVYIGNQIQNIEDDFSDFFSKKDTVFITFDSQNEGYDLSSTQGAQNFLTEKSSEINSASSIFIDEPISINILDGILKMQKNKGISFEGKNIFIITGGNYSFLSKVIAPYINQIGLKKIGFIKNENFLDSINNLLKEEIGGVEYLSFDKEKNFFSLNSFIRYLTYSGLELSLVGFILSISFTILIINFSKQFIGLHVFGVYYPILMALVLTFLNIYFVVAFFTIGFLSIYILSLLSKRMYLLYFSKRAILITLFILLGLIFLGIDNYFGFGIIRMESFSNRLVLFPLIIIILIADKVLHEEVKIFSKKGVYYLIEFIIITFISYFTLNSSTIQYFLLSYPDLLFIIFILNILIGRYTGLQLLEAIRFAPLLKKLSEEE